MEDMNNTTNQDLQTTVEIEPYATSGVLTNNFRTGYAVQISWVVNSQNIANNTSNVTVKAQLVSTSSGYYITSSATKNGSLTINGTTYNFTFSASLSGGQTKTVFTKTVDILHNSDGTKTLEMATTLGIKVTLTGVYWGNVSKSGSGTLNTIPRSSTISLSASSVAVGSAITVNITRASTAFTHKVYYKFGTKSVTISTSATTSASYTIPTDHATVIPNATSGSATITVDTYNGSTKIGSTSKTFTITVPTSIKPSLTGLTATVVASGAATSYSYVQGKSKCTLAITGAAGSQGSTIKSYSISGGGFSSTASSFTTGVLNTSGTITFTATVTDSRGRKSDAKTVSISVQSYSTPNISKFTVIRCDANGNAKSDGTYISVSPTFSYSSLGGKNTISASIAYKTTSASTWSSAVAVTSGSAKVTGAGAISASSSYDVQLTVKDAFTTVTKSLVVPTAFVTLDIKKGGKGIGIGKAAETDNLVDIGMNLKVTGSGNTQISSTGKSVSWLAGCKGDGAIINITSQSGYSPILRQKTTSGAWAMGVYTSDTFHLTYMTDTNINAGTNTVTTQYSFPINGGGTVYTTGNKPTPAAIGAAPATHTHTEYAAASHGTHVSDSGWKSLTLASGISLVSGGVARYKKVNSTVYVQINASGISHTGGATAVAKTIATLPSGYRPSAYIPFDATAGASQPTPCRIECNTDGTIKFRSSLNTITTSYPIHIFFSFVI